MVYFGRRVLVRLEELDSFPIWAVEKSDRGGDRAELYIFWFNRDRLPGLTHMFDRLARVGGGQGDMREQIRGGRLISCGGQRRK